MIKGYQVLFSVKTPQKSAIFRPQASALVFFVITRNFKDKNTLTYFGGSHLRSCDAVAEWVNTSVRKLGLGFNYLLGHRFYQTKIILNLAY